VTAPTPETTVPRQAAFRAELQIIEAEIARLTTAIAQAPDLGSLLTALRQKEQHRARLQQDLARLDGVRRVTLPDAATLTTVVLGKVGDWSGLMGRRVGQARDILRKVLVGRLAFTPKADGTWDFVGYADPGPLFAGTVLADRGNLLVSPTGLAHWGPRSWWRAAPPSPASRMGDRPPGGRRGGDGREASATPVRAC